MGTYVQLRKRTAYLRGETDYSVSSANTIINDDINASIEEAVNAFDYSWTRTLTTDTFSSLGVITLPTDYNPRWHIPDMRSSNGNVWQEIPLSDRDLWAAGSCKYWILYDNTLKRYKAYTLTVSTLVSYIYHFIPAALTADADVCVVPDTEAIAYLAASKNWLSDERNQSLKGDYENEAQTRLKAMYATDLAFGPQDRQGSVLDDNANLIWS